MKTIEIKLYKFSELSKEAKQKAIELCDINVDNWWESSYEDAERVFCIISSFDTGRGNYCDLNFTLSAYEVASEIKSEHGVNCDTYKKAINFINSYDNLVAKYSDGTNQDIVMEENNCKFDEEVEELEENFEKIIADCYLTMLINDCEYRTSKEAIIETIEANEYDFTEDGKLY